MFRPSCFFIIIIVVLFVLDVTGSLIILSINFFTKISCFIIFMYQNAITGILPYILPYKI